jgi:hypothetical protein
MEGDGGTGDASASHGGTSACHGGSATLGYDMSLRRLRSPSPPPPFPPRLRVPHNRSNRHDRPRSRQCQGEPRRRQERRGRRAQQLPCHIQSFPPLLVPDSSLTCAIRF